MEQVKLLDLIEKKKEPHRKSTQQVNNYLLRLSSNKRERDGGLELARIK